MFKLACVVQAVSWGTVGRERKLAGELPIDVIAESVWKVRPQKVIVL
ncbi:uncharacterized protein METZ01_LOCUS258166 [marine metagenome]|uniref:Uncharacterized protein n=1 Tax=marine metagenome TaxID=408172 RepID=A0A382J1M7_9ZZZZ